MDSIGHLSEGDGRVEFRYDPLGLVVRGNYAEWVLEAAAEIIAQTERLQTDGRIEELETLSEFGEAEPIDLDSARHEANDRFEMIPQCIVSMGRLDYKWTAAIGRERAKDEYGDHPIRRIHDMSMTRNDTFLKDVDVDGADTASSDS